MATYVIGDIHGCYDELQLLLESIKFNPNQDTLWFTGDLINGGPKPAEVLRFIKNLGDKHICILGNHDLVLLALAAEKIIPHNDRKIGFEPVFAVDDWPELIEWLRMRPLIHYDASRNIVLVHAGVLPQWNIKQIQEYAREVEASLQGANYHALYENMFGNQPEQWNDKLSGWERLRFIINCMTRMRFCTPEGKLDLIAKGEMHTAPTDYLPWFQLPRHDDLKIIFGHWAALRGKTGVANIIAMDTGCVWGNELSALNLDTGTLYSVEKINN